MKIFVRFCFLLAGCGASAQPLRNLLFVPEPIEPIDELEFPRPPKILTSDGLAVGSAVKRYDNGLSFDLFPGISKFHFNFNLVPDKHIKQIMVLPTTHEALVAYNDKDKDTNFYFQVKAIELPPGTKYIRKHMRGRGCVSLPNISYEPNYVPVLSEFDLEFEYHADYELERISVQTSMSSNWLTLEVCFHNSDEKGYFQASVGIALVPKDKVASNLGHPGCGQYECTAGGLDSGGSAVSSIGIVENARPALDSFLFEFQNCGLFYSDRDHHLDIISVDLSQPGEANVKFQDKNADDDYHWRVGYVFVTN